MNLEGSVINWEMRKGREWMKRVKEERLVKAKVCVKAPTFITQTLSVKKSHQIYL